MTNNPVLTSFSILLQNLVGDELVQLYTDLYVETSTKYR